MHKDVHCIIYNKNWGTTYTHNVKKSLLTRQSEWMFANSGELHEKCSGIMVK